MLPLLCKVRHRVYKFWMVPVNRVKAHQSAFVVILQTQTTSVLCWLLMVCKSALSNTSILLWLNQWKYWRMLLRLLSMALKPVTVLFLSLLNRVKKDEVLLLIAASGLTNHSVTYPVFLTLLNSRTGWLCSLALNLWMPLWLMLKRNTDGILIPIQTGWRLISKILGLNNTPLL